MPEQKVHLHVESVDWMSNIQLTAGGNQQSYEGWQTLEKELSAAVQKVPVKPNMVGIPMLILSGLLAVGAGSWMLSDQPAVAAALNELLMN
jgi:hypothetical protein